MFANERDQIEKGGARRTKTNGQQPAGVCTALHPSCTALHCTALHPSCTALRTATVLLCYCATVRTVAGAGLARSCPLGLISNDTLRPHGDSPPPRPPPLPRPSCAPSPLRRRIGSLPRRTELCLATLRAAPALGHICFTFHTAERRVRPHGAGQVRGRVAVPAAAPQPQWRVAVVLLRTACATPPKHTSGGRHVTTSASAGGLATTHTRGGAGRCTCAKRATAERGVARRPAPARGPRRPLPRRAGKGEGFLRTLLRGLLGGVHRFSKAGVGLVVQGDGGVALRRGGGHPFLLLHPASPLDHPLEVGRQQEADALEQTRERYRAFSKLVLID
eukprot:1181822-Prorocentrum_minimum.AAC.7